MSLIEKYRNKRFIWKFHFWVKSFIVLSLIVAMFLAIYEQNWMAIFISCLTLILIFSTSIFQKKYSINLPPEFELVIVIFLYFALFLGEVQNFYTQFWWWDMILHTGSGFALGIVGFLILYTLNQQKKFSASPFWIAIFSFCFALALGSL